MSEIRIKSQKLGYLDGEFNIIPEAVKNRIENELGYSLNEFAKDIAKIDPRTLKKILDGDSNLNASTVNVLLQALIHHDDAPMKAPPQKLEAPLRDAMIRKWYCYHQSRHLGKPFVAKTELDIQADCKCTLYHGFSGHLYSGKVTVEPHGLIINFHYAGADMNDTMTYRCSHPWAEEAILFGGWVGRDFDHNICCGPIILSTEELDDQEIMFYLNQNQHVLYPVTNNAIQYHPRWEEGRMADAIRKLKPDEELKIITTFIPNQHGLEGIIKEIGETNKKIKLRVKILFMDYQNTPLVHARFIHRHEYKSNRVERFAQEIRNQAEALLSMNQYAGVKIDLKFSSDWLVAMSFQLGKTKIFYGLMFARETAISGPMFEITDHHTREWRFFEKDFEALWKKARKPDPEEFTSDN